MLTNHRSAIQILVREFYANIHRQRLNSFWTWVRETPIEVTLNWISSISSTPWVLDSGHPYTPDIEPPHSLLVECFAEEWPHTMELEEEGFTPSNLMDEARFNYRIIISRIFSVSSLASLSRTWPFAYIPC